MDDNDELLAALEPVSKTLRNLQIPFHIGGSVASSFHGASRSTMDVDLIADLKAEIVVDFVRSVQQEYYVSEAAMLDAIKRKSCFNLIHLATSFKVDVFVPKSRPFDKSAMNRAGMGKISLSSDLAVPIASPEDTILSKLEWYRLGDEVSERQWDDVIRLVQVLGTKLDRDYLGAYADALGVGDLINRLFEQNSEQ